MPLTEELASHPIRQELIDHPLLTAMREGNLSRTQVGMILGQWYYPLSYFPTFLASLVVSLQRTDESQAIRSQVARVLSQELGDGEPQRAHRNLYLNTMCDLAGFSREVITEAPEWVRTAALIGAYRNTGSRHPKKIGAFYATETADLGMVSAIGAAVRAVCNAPTLPWVDIHVKQEPGHVRDASSVLSSITAEEEEETLQHTLYTWRCWINFFSGIRTEMARRL